MNVPAAAFDSSTKSVIRGLSLQCCAFLVVLEPARLGHRLTTSFVLPASPQTILGACLQLPLVVSYQAHPDTYSNRPPSASELKSNTNPMSSSLRKLLVETLTGRKSVFGRTYQRINSSTISGRSFTLSQNISFFHCLTIVDQEYCPRRKQAASIS